MPKPVSNKPIVESKFCDCGWQILPWYNKCIRCLVNNKKDPDEPNG